MYPPLPLSGATNTRDLGGIPVPGGFTRKGQFLRSGKIAGLSGEDCRMLYDYGVRCVVDLRGPFETAREPSSLEGFMDVEYRNIPLDDQVHGADGGFPDSLEDLYRALLGGQAEFGRIFRTFLKHLDDCILFHCTAGKDRTGLVAMLLLKLAGASDGDIAADYARTEELSAHWQTAQQEVFKLLGTMVPEHVFRAKPETMLATLALLEREYGGAEAYLRGAGLAPAELDALREKLVGRDEPCG